MSVEIFLGEPPADIKKWIIDHHGPAGHPETRITFSDGSSDTYEWSGEINQQTMIDVGLYDEYKLTWTKEPVTVDIGNTVTSIGDYAFEACSELTSVTIPDSVTNIESSAFYGCSGLTSVTIPDSVTSIGEEAFAWCSGLTSMTFNSFTKDEVKSMTTNNYIFSNTFYDDEGNPMEKSFTAICTDGSMTIHFSANEPATITFTDL